MFYLETKDIPRLLGSNIIIDKTRAIIQELEENHIYLNEYLIPLMHWDENTPKEVSIEIDEFILKCLDMYPCFGVNEKTIFFGKEITYDYVQGDIVELVTQLPTLSCCFMVPGNLSSLINSDIIEVSVSKTLNINKVIHYPLEYVFDKIGPFKFDSSCIVEEFEKNKGKFCKMYLEEDFPLCFEFTLPNDVKKRIFIAPIN